MIFPGNGIYEKIPRIYKKQESYVAGKGINYIEPKINQTIFEQAVYDVA